MGCGEYVARCEFGCDLPDGVAVSALEDVVFVGVIGQWVLSVEIDGEGLIVIEAEWQRRVAVGCCAVDVCGDTLLGWGSLET